MKKEKQRYPKKLALLLALLVAFALVREWSQTRTESSDPVIADQLPGTAAHSLQKVPRPQPNMNTPRQEEAPAEVAARPKPRRQTEPTELKKRLDSIVALAGQISPLDQASVDELKQETLKLMRSDEKGFTNAFILSIAEMHKAPILSSFFLVGTYVRESTEAAAGVVALINEPTPGLDPRFILPEGEEGHVPDEPVKLLKVFALRELLGREPGTLGEETDIPTLQQALMDTARNEPNLAIARNAALALLKHTPAGEDQIAEIADARMDTERDAILETLTD